MMDEQLDAKARGFASKIHRSCSTLLDMVKDLVELSRIESDECSVLCDPFSPTELIDNIIESFSPLAKEKGLEIFYQKMDQPALSLYGDAEKIYKILSLFTENALKFTRQGQVTLSLTKVSQTGNMLRLRFSVSDTGPGVDDELKDEIFKQFTQADSSSSRNHGGMGIGLTLSKALVERMGGDIGFDKNSPQGAVFWFEISLAQD